jgi:broad specificity phosphatase PhoE
MPRPSTRIFLVRHAQSDASVNDGGLTELGLRQAKNLAVALGPTIREALLSSPLRRAVQTASAMNRLFSILDDLQEFRFGAAAPDTAEMVAERTDLTLWRSDHGFPGGETLGKFQGRVGRVLEKLVVEHPDGTVVAVTHSGFIDAALRWVYRVSSYADWTTEAVLPNASITEIEHWPSGRHPSGAPAFTLVHRVGDVSHLRAEEITDI